ncbi:MAG: hypothetical protein ACRC2Y_07970 [Aeromonas veronii]|uniref:hypothetical protein n=1 Tax=Aeromonas veronii TaxID=654 RepID=UPI002440FAC1|nr:hypothetical protein [Aeromonas veronii]
MMYSTPHNVEIRKPDGRLSGQFKAEINTASRTIRFEAIQLPADVGDFQIDVGDVVIHHIGNGTEKEYRILDPGFHAYNCHGLEERYVMRVRLLP